MMLIITSPAAVAAWAVVLLAILLVASLAALRRPGAHTAAPRRERPLGSDVAPAGGGDRSGVDVQIASFVAWAIDHGAITVDYQPVVDATTGEVRSVEALVRSWHPALGLLPSEVVVAAAEAHGSALDLFRTVLHQALVAVRGWRDAGLLDHVSVNIAPSLLADPRVADLIDAELTALGLDAAALELEVTEHASVGDLSVHAEALRTRGVRLAIDDFGVGQSTMGRLAGLRADVVKLDRSLVAGLDGDARREHVVVLTNALVHELGGVVVAEGVETEPEAELLRRTGVDAMQGYGLCRPLPFAAMSVYLQEMHDRPR